LECCEVCLIGVVALEGLPGQDSAAFLSPSNSCILNVRWSNIFTDGLALNGTSRTSVSIHSGSFEQLHVALCVPFSFPRHMAKIFYQLQSCVYFTPVHSWVFEHPFFSF
jgi:hypothetical protein